MGLPDSIQRGDPIADLWLYFGPANPGTTSLTLIPRGTTDIVIADSRFYESSIGAGLLLLAGFWFYSFGKKKVAIVLLGAAILAHQLIPLFF